MSSERNVIRRRDKGEDSLAGGAGGASPGQMAYHFRDGSLGKARSRPESSDPFPPSE
jgi:hypothetical protein